MKRVLLLTVVAMSYMAAFAQKTVYIPNEWRNPWPSDSLLYSESDPKNEYTWSKSRSIESDNVIVFWDKGYGSVPPSQAPTAYRVDEKDLLKKCEAFYDLEINQLGFVDPVKSNLSKYKVMVMLNHTTEWVCYGAGYDYMVSALWLGPSACKPVGHSVAHEVGHSFHYMCYSEHSGHQESNTDNTGFHLRCGNGQTIWEQTAQWQAAQSYPGEMFNQSIGVFRKSHNYAYSHEWHRYQSYWFHYYLCQKYNDITTVAQVWNTPMMGQSQGTATDFNQALMKLKGLDAVGLFQLYYDYAARLATWDLEACVPYRNPYIGDFEYRCVKTAEKTYQVALASAPQSSGFNIIPLQVPEAGTTVTTHFTALANISALASGDPAEMLTGETSWAAQKRNIYVYNTNYANRGFRLGYVALMNDGTRQYFNQDILYCTGSEAADADVSMVMPANVSRLWLIVVPAPKKYMAHRWTDKATNAEQWPYSIRLEGTDLTAKATVYEPKVEPVIDGRAIRDITLTYDLYFPFSSSVYPAVTFNVIGQAAGMLGTAFQMQPTDVNGRMQAYSAAGPSVGRIMCYPCHPQTGAIVNRGRTANGYGHWFNATGNVSDYGSGFVYSEPDFSNLSFTVGQYPGKCRNGQTYTIQQALKYNKSATETATARFVFNIHIQEGDATAKLSRIDYEDPTAIGMINREDPFHKDHTCYDLQGRKTDRQKAHGLYIVDGRKVIR